MGFRVYSSSTRSSLVPTHTCMQQCVHQVLIWTRTLKTNTDPDKAIRQYAVQVLQAITPVPAPGSSETPEQMTSKTCSVTGSDQPVYTQELLDLFQQVRLTRRVQGVPRDLCDCHSDLACQAYVQALLNHICRCSAFSWAWLSPTCPAPRAETEEVHQEQEVQAAASNCSAQRSVLTEVRSLEACNHAAKCNVSVMEMPNRVWQTLDVKPYGFSCNACNEHTSKRRQEWCLTPRAGTEHGEDSKRGCGKREGGTARVGGEGVAHFVLRRSGRAAYLGGRSLYMSTTSVVHVTLVIHVHNKRCTCRACCAAVGRLCA